MRHLFILFFLFNCLLSNAQHYKDYDVFLGDTINIIDKNGDRQGRWVFFGKDEKGLKNKLLKYNRIITDGIYLNNEKNGVWKSYHSNTNKIKSEVAYLVGQINGKVKLYDEKGKITHEGVMRDKNWVGDYFIYNTLGEKIKRSEIKGFKTAYLKFSGIVSKSGRSLEDVEITIEKNELPLFSSILQSDGVFSFDLELQNLYVITFSKKGFNKTSVLLNTFTETIFDTSVYALSDWKVSMTDNFAASATSGLFGFILNKPTNKIRYSKRKKQFTADGSYENLIKKQLNNISNSTKLLMATTMETNKKLEIENLRIETDAKLKQIELLKKEQELQQEKLHKQETELLTKKLEAEKKEQTLALLEQEKKINQLKMHAQQNEVLQKQLEAAKKAREIERLNALANKHELDAVLQKKLLTEAEKKIEEDRQKKQIADKELELANKEKRVKEAELEAKQKSFNIALIGLFIIVAILLFLVRIYMQKKKANELLAQQKLELQSQRDEIEEKSKVIDEKNVETQQSILYAKRIQNAILPPTSEMDMYLKNYFVLYKSKDIVSGDFYFFSDKHAEGQNRIIIAAADCTGHGVPGAFMSMIGSEKIKDAVDLTHRPHEIIKELNVGLKSALHQSGEKGTRDGMDISVLTLPTDYHKLSSINIEYSGANRPLWVIKHNANQVLELKATKNAVGGLTPNNQEFDLHEVELSKNDTVYLFSDGYADQFGGGKAKKMMTKRFKDILLEINKMNLADQREYLSNFFEEWKGGNEQVDDILVIGIRL